MTQKTKTKLSVIPRVFSAILVCIAFICFFAARWYVTVYGRLGFDSVIYTLSSDLGGTQSGLIFQFLLKAVLPALLCAGTVILLLLFRPRKRNGKFQSADARPRHRNLKAVLLSLALITFAAYDVELIDYLLDQKEDGDLFETSYVDPAGASITFPEEKRNLVYIMLESMETTYLSKELGGAMEENLIPELYQLASDNNNFSHNTGVGGYYCTTGATWTIGSMVAQTAGIPLKTPTEDVNQYGADGTDFLPGVTSLMDILHGAGYYQTLMVGSDVSFGGRESYYAQHGADQLYDIYTARKDDIIADDYFVWWGMEDKYLFEYAKQELTEISALDQPFAFTMLTVDTHHIGGYQCEYCEESASGETYDQSISCSSRQVAGFVAWLQAQPFYENTTVIIVGDHETMDNGYIQRMVDDDYQQMVYNCFINSAAETSNTQNREFAAIDLFPTTLAALGCTIEGDRLGLGTNLYSNTPTLAEEMGIKMLDAELAKSSAYYEAHFYTP